MKEDGRISRYEFVEKVFLKINDKMLKGHHTRMCCLCLTYVQQQIGVQ
jgi:hypothetical protein